MEDIQLIPERRFTVRDKEKFSLVSKREVYKNGKPTNTYRYYQDSVEIQKDVYDMLAKWHEEN